jgi:glucose-6-phosphate 1-dehydrogenase
MFPMDARSKPEGHRNEINIDFKDPGSIVAGFLAEELGPDIRLGEAKFTFQYKDSFVAANDVTGYERLILDALLGNQSLFTSADQVERLWEVWAPLLEHATPISHIHPDLGAPPRSVPSPHRIVGTCPRKIDAGSR